MEGCIDPVHFRTGEPVSGSGNSLYGSEELNLMQVREHAFKTRAPLNRNGFIAI